MINDKHLDNSNDPFNYDNMYIKPCDQNCHTFYRAKNIQLISGISIFQTEKSHINVIFEKGICDIKNKTIIELENGPVLSLIHSKKCRVLDPTWKAPINFDYDNSITWGQLHASDIPTIEGDKSEYIQILLDPCIGGNIYQAVKNSIYREAIKRGLIPPMSQGWTLS